MRRIGVARKPAGGCRDLKMRGDAHGSVLPFLGRAGVEDLCQLVICHITEGDIVCGHHLCWPARLGVMLAEIRAACGLHPDLADHQISNTMQVNKI